MSSALDDVESTSATPHSDQSSQTAVRADESTPLLTDGPVERTPLPKAQIATLCAVRLNDPLAYSQIFPYINEYIYSLGELSDPAKVGMYSGLVETVFALTECFTIYAWARLSDTIGRRPVLLVGICGIGTTTLLFGFSTSIAQLLLFRCIGGLFAGNVAVFHSILAELTDVTNQASAYPIYGFAWPLGSIIGPLIGGYFSRPAERFPGIFDVAFLRSFPYILPCLVCGCASLFCGLLAAICLEETLPSKWKRKYVESSEDDDQPVKATQSLSDEPILSLKQLLALPRIQQLILANFCLGFHATAVDVVFVLFCYSPVSSGGVAFSAAQIGTTMAFSGAATVFIQLTLMPTILRTFDTTRLFRFFVSFFPMAYILMPIVNILYVQSGESRAVLIAGIICILACTRTADLTYAVNTIIIKDNAPNTNYMGATNGIVQTSACVARAMSPAFVSTLYSLSVQHHLLGGHLWSVIMMVLGVVGLMLS